MRLSRTLIAHAMSVTARNFYRKPLPQSCVDFASAEGKKMFTESLIKGHANIYFKLASQFRTQDDPAFCGPSTLVMVLNALEVDPGKIWRAPWRFYHESMLDCCVPLDNIRKTGINLGQFACLATCNRLDVKLHYGDMDDEAVHSFRSNVISSTRSEDCVMVASYDRSVLDQTGTGHFSPIGAYHEESDSVLILDVARFKYPPHWVHLPRLARAMASVDPTTKLSRGYVLLRLRGDSRPLVMFGLRANMSCRNEEFASNAMAWCVFLREAPIDDDQEELTKAVRKFSQFFTDYAMCSKGDESMTCCRKMGSVAESQSHTECSQIICKEIRQTTVANILMSSSVAALFFAWPFQKGLSVRSDRLRDLSVSESKQFSVDTKNEIAVLSTQLTTLIACAKPPLKFTEDVML